MTQHKLLMNGPPGNLSAWVAKCSCGQWEAKMPAVGPYGRKTAKARISQVTMAHGKHAKFANIKGTASVGQEHIEQEAK